MADPTPDNANPPTSAPPGAPAAPELNPPPSWSQLWQGPVLLAGIAMLGIWLYLTLNAPKAKNDFPGAIDSIGQYLKANNFDEARGKLNATLPFIAESTKEDHARLEQLWGDLIYLEQRHKNVDVAENHKAIVEHYTAAQEMGQPFDPAHFQWWAYTLVAQGQNDKAFKLLEELKEQPAELSYMVVRDMIDRGRRLPGAKPQTMAPLIGRFQDMVRNEKPEKRREQEIWLSGVEAEITLATGESERAVDALLRRINALTGTSPKGDDDLAPLMVLLAKSYLKAGQNNKARTWFNNAQKKLVAADSLNADVLVGLGQLDLSESNDVRTALENFAAAQSQYSANTPAFFDALIGRADCEARLGMHPDAIEHFGKAVKIVLDQSPGSEGGLGAGLADERRQQVFNTIHTHFDACNERDHYELALDYLSLLPPLFAKQQELPPKLLIEFASTHEKIANSEQFALTPGSDAPAKGEDNAKDGDVTLTDDDTEHVAAGESHQPTTKPAGRSAEQRAAAQRAIVHLGKAAEYYVKHAHAVSLADEAAYGSSLWKAAECYDRAQLWKNAIDVYTEFVRSRGSDSRRLHALLQLGLAFEADGQYAPAIERLKQIIESQPRSTEAYASMVPLARCYVATGLPEDAKRVLAYVVKDHPTITPDSAVYRDSLIELGKLHYKLGEYKQAIERLQLAVDRYKDGPGAAELRFRLADAYRRSIEDVDKDLLEPMPQTKKIALQGERSRRLDQAQVLFSQVINDLEARSPASLSPLEQLYFRNAYFYRADCAYDLKRYEQAIQLYDLAAKRFENHPSALVALVQIVNAYCELGRVQEARVANLRARSLLKRIPDEAFNDPNLPMTRAHWEDWLKWTSEMDVFKGDEKKAPSTASAEP